MESSIYKLDIYYVILLSDIISVCKDNVSNLIYWSTFICVCRCVEMNYFNFGFKFVFILSLERLSMSN